MRFGRCTSRPASRSRRWPHHGNAHAFHTAPGQRTNARVPHRAGSANERTCSTLRRGKRTRTSVTTAPCPCQPAHVFHTAPEQANERRRRPQPRRWPRTRVPHRAGSANERTRSTLRRGKRTRTSVTTAPCPCQPAHVFHTAPEQARDLSERASRRHRRALADLHTTCTLRRSKRVTSRSARPVGITAPSPTFTRLAHRAGAGAWPLRAPIASTTLLRPRRASHDLRTAPE